MHYFFDKNLSCSLDVDKQPPDEDEHNAHQALRRSTTSKVQYMVDCPQFGSVQVQADFSWTHTCT